MHWCQQHECIVEALWSAARADTKLHNASGSIELRLMDLRQQWSQSLQSEPGKLRLGLLVGYAIHKRCNLTTCKSRRFIIENSVLGILIR